MKGVLKASKFIQLPDDFKSKLLKSKVVIPVNDTFIPYFGNRDEIVLLYGSYGSGKSKFVAQDLIEKCRKDEYFKCFYLRKIFEEVRKSFFDDLCTEIEERGLQDEFSYSRRDNSSMIITHRNGNKFVPAGASDSKNLKSIKDASHIVCEEFDQFSNKDFGFLFSRLRTEKAQTQFYGMFNTEPLVEGHWIRETFFNSKQESHLKPLKIFGTYIDNYFINKEDYEAKLRLIANGREHVFQAIANGEFGISSNDNPFFYTYKPEHSTLNDYPIDSNKPIEISFDFNINPCTAVISQKISNIIHVFDIILENQNSYNGLSSLEAVCKTINDKYFLSGKIKPYLVRVTGDSSGRSGSADRQEARTFYYTIANNLRLNEGQINVRKSNLTHVFSGKMCNNAIGKGLVRFWNVNALTTDIGRAFADSNGGLDEAKKKYGLHCVDAFRYLIDLYYSYVGNSFLTDPQRILNNIR